MIGFGGFASVYVANWKNTVAKFAIKKFAKFTTKNTEEIIINEVCLYLYKLDHSENYKFSSSLFIF